MINTISTDDKLPLIRVEPNNNIFKELGNNTYDFVDLISELIDNCIAAKVDGLTLQVSITISTSSDRKNSYFIIRDNASGIARDKIGRAITPAGEQGNSLNEHGLGMKQAVASLGELEYLLTKTENETHAVKITEFKFGDIYPSLENVSWPHGTKIKVTNLRSIVPTNQTSYSRSIIKYLGARYRRYLLPDATRMMLSIELRDNDDNDKVLQTWSVEQIKPVYFHPSTRTNKPVIEKKQLKGKGWEVELTFGYAPDEKEYTELGLSSPTKFDPYNVSLKNQGFDLFVHDRVINFHMLSEIGLVDVRHNDYNLARGEIDLKKGFVTAITKNAILQDERLQDCLSYVKSILHDGGYLKRKTYPGDLPEKALRDRLAHWLETNTLSPKTSVKTEYAVAGLDGNIDVLADGEVWEIKRDQAYGLDIYQLFGYMDMGNFAKGYLLAKSWTTSAEAARDHINKYHGKTIILDVLANYPINQPLTDDERDKYF